MQEKSDQERLEAKVLSEIKRVSKIISDARREGAKRIYFPSTYTPEALKEIMRDYRPESNEEKISLLNEIISISKKVKKAEKQISPKYTGPGAALASDALKEIKRIETEIAEKKAFSQAMETAPIRTIDDHITEQKQLFGVEIGKIVAQLNDKEIGKKIDKATKVFDNLIKLKSSRYLKRGIPILVEGMPENGKTPIYKIDAPLEEKSPPKKSFGQKFLDISRTSEEDKENRLQRVAAYIFDKDLRPKLNSQEKKVLKEIAPFYGTIKQTADNMIVGKFNLEKHININAPSIEPEKEKTHEQSKVIEQIISHHKDDKSHLDVLSEKKEEQINHPSGRGF